MSMFPIKLRSSEYKKEKKLLVFQLLINCNLMFHAKVATMIVYHTNISKEMFIRRYNTSQVH